MNTSDPPSLCCYYLLASIHTCCLAHHHKTHYPLDAQCMAVRTLHHYLLNACCIAVRRLPHYSLYARCITMRKFHWQLLRLHEETARGYTDCAPAERWLYSVSLLDPSTLFQTALSVSFSRTLKKVPVVHPSNSKALAQQQV
jgi:hypothetical protein